MSLAWRMPARAPRFDIWWPCTIWPWRSFPLSRLGILGVLSCCITWNMARLMPIVIRKDATGRVDSEHGPLFSIYPSTMNSLTLGTLARTRRNKCFVVKRTYGIVLLTNVLAFLQDLDSQGQTGKLSTGVPPHGHCFHHVGSCLQPVGMASSCHAIEQCYSHAHVYLVRGIFSVAGDLGICRISRTQSLLEFSAFSSKRCFQRRKSRPPDISPERKLLNFLPALPCRRASCSWENGATHKVLAFRWPACTCTAMG